MYDTDTSRYWYECALWWLDTAKKELKWKDFDDCKYSLDVCKIRIKWVNELIAEGK